MTCTICARLNAFTLRMFDSICHNQLERMWRDGKKERRRKWLQYNLELEQKLLMQCYRQLYLLNKSISMYAGSRIKRNEKWKQQQQQLRCALLTATTLMHSTSQLLMRSTCTTHFHFATVIVLSNNKLMLTHVMYFILEWHYTSQISSGLLFVFKICESCPLKINIFHLGLLTMHSKLQALLLKSAASFESL